MSLITRSYSFTDGTTAYGSQVDAEIANIVNTVNSLDQGSTTWTNVKVTTLLPQSDVNMSGYKITGLANGSASTDAVAYGQISNISIVTGSLIMYPLKTPPTGYLYCDGSAVSRGTYATLFGIVGTIFGSGNGTTTFNVPDLRGRFIRGVDDGTARDPDAASRTAMNSGGNSGDAAGSLQTAATASHTHSVTDPGHTHVENAWSNIAGGSTYYVMANTAIAPDLRATQSTQSSTTGITLSNTGGNETRPINAGIYFHIKY